MLEGHPIANATLDPLDDYLVVEPGDKVLFPRDAGFEVRLARSSHRVRVLKREDVIARILD